MENYLFLGDYAGSSYDSVAEQIYCDFQIEKSEIDKYLILVAGMSEEQYEGSQYLLLLEKSTGDLFEVSGSHCSCYGYEGQFDAQKTDIRYLLDEHYSCGYGDKTVNKNIQKLLVSKVRYLKLEELFKEEWS